jgi:hypothetical protein
LAQWEQSGKGTNKEKKEERRKKKERKGLTLTGLLMEGATVKQKNAVPQGAASLSPAVLESDGRRTEVAIREFGTFGWAERPGLRRTRNFSESCLQSPMGKAVTEVCLQVTE